MRVNKRDMVNHDKLVDTKAMLRSGGGGRAPKGSREKDEKEGQGWSQVETMKTFLASVRLV